jgi:hypothetical protein
MRAGGSPTRPGKGGLGGKSDAAMKRPPSYDKRADQIIQLRTALRDLLAFQNRRGDAGWSAADISRMNEIKELAK